MGEGDSDRVTFRDVLAIPEFRALYVAQSLSVIGDQVARIAVATLIFDRTHSSLVTGASYALSYVPWLIGGPTLSVLADRRRRRNVMLWCDLVRTVLIGVGALLDVPTGLLLCLIATVGLLQPPFSAARAGVIPEVVGEGPSYTAASTLGNSTNQLAVVIGFAVGGATVGWVGPHVALGADAVTFAISAVVIARCVKARPPAHWGGQNWSADMRDGAIAVFGDRYVRWLVTTSWIVVGTAITTEAIAVPYARAHGHGPMAAGVLTAALPAGTFAGALLLGRVVRPAVAEGLLGTLTTVMPLTLLLTVFNPSVTLAGGLWFLVGAASATSVVANRIFVVAVPAELRSRAFGIAAAGISASQGVGTLFVGALARHVTPANAIALTATLSFGLRTLLGPRPGDTRAPNYRGTRSGLRTQRTQPRTIDEDVSAFPAMASLHRDHLRPNSR